jgi:hypothetical protein
VTYDAREADLYISVFFGIVAAIGVGFGLHGMRTGTWRRFIVAELSLLLNAGFLFLAFIRLVRWL